MKRDRLGYSGCIKRIKGTGKDMYSSFLYLSQARIVGLQETWPDQVFIIEIKRVLIGL